MFFFALIYKIYIMSTAFDFTQISIVSGGDVGNYNKHSCVRVETDKSTPTAIPGLWSRLGRLGLGLILRNPAFDQRTP